MPTATVRTNGVVSEPCRAVEDERRSSANTAKGTRVRRDADERACAVAAVTS